MASRHLQLQFKISCYNTYVDFFYHQLSCTRFVYVTSKIKSERDFNIEKMAIDTFCSYDIIKILQKKEAYVLHELLRGVSSISEMHVLV